MTLRTNRPAAAGARRAPWLAALAALATIAACTPAPTAPDAEEPDVTVNPGDDVETPGEDVPVAPMMDRAAPPRDAGTDAPRTDVVPGTGSGPASALPRMTGTSPSAACTALGALVIPDGAVAPEAAALGGGQYAAWTAMSYVQAGVQYALIVEFVGAPAAWVNVRNDLALPPQNDFSTSTVMIVAASHCHDSPGGFVCDHWYLPRGGAGAFTEIPVMAGQRLAARFSAVVFDEYTLDWQHRRATRVTGTRCLSLDWLSLRTSALPLTPVAPGVDAGGADAATGGSGTLSGGEGGLRQRVGGASSGPLYTCSSSDTTCFMDLPDCTWTSGSASGVCTHGCRLNTDCPDGAACVAMGGQGRCMYECVGGRCDDRRVACVAVADSLGRSTPVCLPPEWYAPARCGDGACNGGETCGSCRGDCGGCACTGCATSGDCGPGEQCVRRGCDAARACQPTGTPDNYCGTVNDVECPAIAAYDRCNGGRGNTECGSTAECLPVGDYRCRPFCRTDADCILVPAGFESRPRSCNIVDSAGTPTWCSIPCSSATDTCPYGGRCVAYPDGHFGMCQ